MKIGKTTKIYACTDSKKYHIDAATALLQVPGAGLNFPIPNHVARR
jgi:hypothetical protein